MANGSRVTQAMGGKEATASTQPPSGAPGGNPSPAVPAEAVGHRTPVGAPVDFHITEHNARETIERLLRGMGATATGEGASAHAKATDLHINPGRPPDYRIGRVIRSVASAPLSQQDVMHLSNGLMNKQQQERFNRNHCIDCSYHVDKNRFRVNIVESFNGRSISIRRFEEIKDFSQYNLPDNYIDIC